MLEIRCAYREKHWRHSSISVRIRLFPGQRAYVITSLDQDGDYAEQLCSAIRSGSDSDKVNFAPRERRRRFTTDYSTSKAENQAVQIGHH